MLKNTQNKESIYYEVGVIDKDTKLIIEEYVTSINIIKKEGIIHEKLMDLMYKTHGYNIMVLFNKKNGEIPDDHRSVINIDIPEDPKLSYNR